MFEENINIGEEKIAEENINSIPETELKEENSADNTEQEQKTEQSIPQNEEPPVFNMFYLTREQIEKKEVKKLGRVSGVAFLVFEGIMFLLSGIIVAIVKIFSLNQTQIYNFLSEPAISQVQQILFSILLFTLPFIAVYKLYGYRISDLISFKVPKGKKSFYLFLVGISFCSFANIAANMAGQFFDNAGIEYEVDFGDEPLGFFGFMLSFIAMSIVPALVEEFACRGIIMGSLKKQGEAFAIIVSSVIFGLMHSNFEQIPFAFLVGLILGYITVKADTIWIAIGVHFFNNFVPVMYSYVLNKMSVTAQNLSYTVFLIITMLLGMFAFTKLKDEDIFTLKSDEFVTPLSKRIKWFFTSVPVIVFISICLLSSLAYFK